jgi:hypothetical protein
MSGESRGKKDEERERNKEDKKEGIEEGHLRGRKG